jgi:hypothetical protein
MASLSDVAAMVSRKARRSLVSVALTLLDLARKLTLGDVALPLL